MADAFLRLSLIHISSALGIPLYLDTLGTVLSAAILGPVPGIIVGALSNIITGPVSYTHLASLESQTEVKRRDHKMVEKVTELDEAIKSMKEEYGRKVSVDACLLYTSRCV